MCAPVYQKRRCAGASLPWRTGVSLRLRASVPLCGNQIDVRFLVIDHVVKLFIHITFQNLYLLVDVSERPVRLD